MNEYTLKLKEEETERCEHVTGRTSKHSDRSPLTDYARKSSLPTYDQGEPAVGYR